VQQKQRRSMTLRREIRARGDDVKGNGVENRIRTRVDVDSDGGRCVCARTDPEHGVAFELAVVAVMLRRVLRVIMRVRRERQPDRQLTGMAEDGQQDEKEHERG